MKSKSLVSRFSTAIVSFSLGTRGESKMATRMFLEIAEEELCTSQYLQDRLDVVQATVSRTTRQLGARRNGKTAYPHLVQSFPDAEDPKKYRYCLTERGREKLNELLVILEGETEPSTSTG